MKIIKTVAHCRKTKFQICGRSSDTEPETAKGRKRVLTGGLERVDKV